jgi:hypothetical protein
VLAGFAADWSETLRVPLTAQTMARVPDLCRRHPLRGADAVHLSAALFLRDEGLDGEFVCGDERLLAAARAEGLRAVDPAAEEAAAPAPSPE